MRLTPALDARVNQPSAKATSGEFFNTIGAERTFGRPGRERSHRPHISAHSAVIVSSRTCPFARILIEVIFLNEFAPPGRKSRPIAGSRKANATG
jgi:hypothetical protein